MWARLRRNFLTFALHSILEQFEENGENVRVKLVKLKGRIVKENACKVFKFRE